MPEVQQTIDSCFSIYKKMKRCEVQGRRLDKINKQTTANRFILFAYK